MNRKKYLAKNTVLFALNSIGSKLIVFFLVPIYTKALSTAEYGLADLVTTLATVIVPIITLNINEAIMRFSLDDDADIDRILSVGSVMLAFSVIVGLLILPIMNLFPALYQYRYYIYLYCITDGLFKVCSYCLRGLEKLQHFAICNILMTLCSAAFNILFLIVLKWGIVGYFTAFILAYLFGSVYAIISGNLFSVFQKFHFNTMLAKQMVCYSLVLVPNSMMWWVMHSSDRVMVTAMVGLAANGIYAVSYKIPSVVSTLSQVFNQAWSYSAIHEDKSEDRENFNNRMFEKLLAFQVLVTAALILCMKPFLRFYVSESYYEAWKYTPYLLVGNFFMTLGTFLSTSYTVNKDSKGFLFSGMTGALINVFMNAILIPLIGVSGAALATCISYIVVFIYRIFDTRKYIHIKVLNKRNVLLYVLIIIMAATMLIDNYFGAVAMCVEMMVILVLSRKFIVDCFELGTSFLKRICKK